MIVHKPLVRFLLSVLLAATTAGIATAQGNVQEASEERPVNVILFIADGGGPASFTLARDYVRWKEGREALAFDSLLVGTIRTFSSDSRVTDSGAGATAFSAGRKTYNGAIAVDDQQRPVATLLEAAERRGMATGLVATSRITHATPASFAAHVPDRWMEDEIASQMLVSGVDVLMGGGKRHLLPDTTLSRIAPNPPDAGSTLAGGRSDHRNLIEEARSRGYHVVEDRSALLDARSTPLLAALAPSQMDYEVDRDAAVQPSLREMTRKAIELLEDASEEGFFLMVEGSRIDHAAHDNDPAGHLYDVLAYEKALEEALNFARRDGRTLVVATSDHETGGLTLGRDDIYAWHPDVLDRVKASQTRMIEAVEADPAKLADTVMRLGGLDSLSSDERHLLATTTVADESGDIRINAARLRSVLAEIISERALLGWTSGGHTGVDVNVYAFGPARDRFVGNRDNTEIGLALADLMDVDLDSLTDVLRQPLKVSEDLEIVGHRGARGLLPENTIPSFRAALELGVKTIEIDVVSTKDDQVVVSHEPWMHHVICVTPEGKTITEAEEHSYNLYEMTYDEVARFDCGSPGHPDFPEQRPMAIEKPLLSDVIEASEQYISSIGREPVWYNVEIKSKAEWDGIYTPTPEEFMPRVYDVLKRAGVLDRTIIQSFDPRPLRVMHGIDPSLKYALLVGRTDGDTFAENIADLGFEPAGYNPNYHLVDEALLAEVHGRGMELVPWTVNEISEMERLVELGVDGLITDYPDRAREVLRRRGLLPQPD